MPQVISTTGQGATAMTLPNQMLLTRNEALQLATKLEMLRRREIDEIVITNDSAKTVKVRRDGVADIYKPMAQSVADTTWTQSGVVASLAGHNLIRLMHAFQQWGATVTDYVLDVPASPFTSIRFTLTGNVSL